MRSRSIWAVAATLLALPAAAGASMIPPTKHAQFELSLRGSQTTTWHLYVKGHPPCAASVTTDGDQMIRFRTVKPQVVYVKQEFGLPSAFDGLDPVIDASAERNMEFRTGKPIVVNRRCVRIVPIPPYAEPGCKGQRNGTIHIQLGFDADALGFSEQNDPLKLKSDDNHLRIKGYAADFGGGRYLLTTYPTCPMLVPISGYPPNQGDLFEAAGYLQESRLFGKSNVLRMSSSHVYPFSTPTGIRGTTIVTYNLTLRRVGSS